MKVREESEGAAATDLGVEDLALAGLGRGDEVLLEDGEDVFANVAEFGLDLERATAIMSTLRGLMRLQNSLPSGDKP